MGSGPARITEGNRRDVAPAAGARGRAGMFALVAAAGLALASGAVTGTPAAHAAVAARTATAGHAHPRFEPCPCDRPICRPGCSQGMTSGDRASMIRWQAHQGGREATTVSASAVIICPPPSGDGMSKSGDPGC
jgi:hypothetical protein